MTSRKIPESAVENLVSDLEKKANAENTITIEQFNSKMQVVSALPANPDPNVFYFIPE